MLSALLNCTEVRFVSFLSGGFITAIVVNPPERNLAKRTSVCSGRHYLFVDNALDKSIKIAESIRNAVKFFFEIEFDLFYTFKSKTPPLLKVAFFQKV